MLDYCKNTYSDCSNGLTKHKWKKCTLTHTLTHRDTDTDRQTDGHTPIYKTHNYNTSQVTMDCMQEKFSGITNWQIGSSKPLRVNY